MIIFNLIVTSVIGFTLLITSIIKIIRGKQEQGLTEFICSIWLLIPFMTFWNGLGLNIQLGFVK